MKKIVLTVMAVATAAFVAYGGQEIVYDITVSTNDVTIVPGAFAGSPATWTNNYVVSQGDYIADTNSTAYTYFAITAGTSTNMPSHTWGVDSTSDQVTWLKLPKGNAQRKNAIIFADSSGTVYYSRGSRAAVTDGPILDALRPARSFPLSNDEIHGITASGSCTVGVSLEY